MTDAASATSTTSDNELVYRSEGTSALSPDVYNGAGLKEEVSARLAAHRARRPGLAAVPTRTPAVVAGSAKRNQGVAAAVAARYAHSPSYRAVLADEAERATQRAAAAAEIAALNAAAIAEAQAKLFAELERWDEPQVAEEPLESAYTQPEPEPIHIPVQEISSAGLTVRLYEDLGREVHPAPTLVNGSGWLNDWEENRTLDEEIAFRQAPVFEQPCGPPETIPGNLLEFPRQLVAARKARPVLALGPLRESSGPALGQLRIFEVEPQEISYEPTMPSTEPVWTSIWLDAPKTEAMAEQGEVFSDTAALQPAPLSRRVMAAAVDGLALAFSFVLFAAAATFFAGELPMEMPVAITGGVALAALTLAYHLLFFTFSDQTPGMRYARIGLCTFNDDNPSRSAIRRRLLAVLVAMCPLGIGILWAALDDERLGWHDRISRMYQRAY